MAERGVRLPRQRASGLIERVVGDEIVLYDTRTDTAHAFDALTAAVWRRCDGQTTYAEAARALSVIASGADENSVAVAVGELSAAGLLDRGSSRRTVLTRGAVVVAGAVVVPGITSIAGPIARAAASTSGTLNLSTPDKPGGTSPNVYTYAGYSSAAVSGTPTGTPPAYSGSTAVSTLTNGAYVYPLDPVTGNSVFYITAAGGMANRANYFTTTFSIPAGATTATLTASMNADDFGYAYLNGTLISPNSTAITYNKPSVTFTATAPFNFGGATNTLVLIANDTGGAPYGVGAGIEVTYH